MKKILTLITLAAGLLFAAESQAQLIPLINPINILTNCASGVTNLATPIVIDCTAQKDIALALTWKLNGAGTDVCGFKLQRSVDGTTALASGIDEYWFRKAANGATGATISTNITVSGYPYLVLSLCSNAVAGQDITNITIRYWVKPNAP